MAIERRPPTTYLRPFAATGLLGGWTTYSTLAVETTTFAKDGDLATAAAYLALTFAAGLLAAVLGIALGRARTPSPGMLPEMAEVTEGEETSR